MAKQAKSGHFRPGQKRRRSDSPLSQEEHKRTRQDADLPPSSHGNSARPPLRHAPKDAGYTSQAEYDRNRHVDRTNARFAEDVDRIAIGGEEYRANDRRTHGHPISHQNRRKGGAAKHIETADENGPLPISKTPSASGDVSGERQPSYHAAPLPDVTFASGFDQDSTSNIRAKVGQSGLREQIAALQRELQKVKQSNTDLKLKYERMTEAEQQYQEGLQSMMRARQDAMDRALKLEEKLGAAQKDRDVTLQERDESCAKTKELEVDLRQYQEKSHSFDKQERASLVVKLRYNTQVNANDARVGLPAQPTAAKPKASKGKRADTAEELAAADAHIDILEAKLEKAETFRATHMKTHKRWSEYSDMLETKVESLKMALTQTDGAEIKQELAKQKLLIDELQQSKAASRQFLATAADFASQEIRHIYGDTAPWMPAITPHSNPTDIALLYKIINAARKQRAEQLKVNMAKGPTMQELEQRKRTAEESERADRLAKQNEARAKRLANRF